MEAKSTPPPMHLLWIPTRTGTLELKTYKNEFCKSFVTLWINIPVLATSFAYKSNENKLANSLRSRPDVKILPSAKKIITLTFSFEFNEEKICLSSKKNWLLIALSTFGLDMDTLAIVPWLRNSNLNVSYDDITVLL